MNTVRATLSNIGAFLTSTAKTAVRQLSLTPFYVQHLLWLIEDSFRDLAKRGYGGNAAVYACIRLLSQAVPEPPLVAYQRQPDGENGDPLNWNHPLRGLIRQPNPLMTEFEMWELVTIHLAICGRSPWFKERDNLGRILNLWPLRPDRVGPIYAGPDDDEQVLLGWSYLVPGTTQYIPIPRRDVVMFNLPDPMGESGGVVEGFGPLQALISEVSADNEATNYVGSLVANYAQPGMVIQTTKPLASIEDATAIKEAFRTDFGGIRRGVPAVIDNGSTLTQTGFNLQQLEFPALREISESRIAAAFGVPAILVGLLVGLNSGIKATTDELRALFAETTLANYWRRFESQYTSDVASEFGPEIVCHFDLTKVRAFAVQANADLDRIAVAYQNGALTKNEYREALGFEERLDGDAYASGIGLGTGIENMLPAGTIDQNMNPEHAEPAVSAPITEDPAAVTDGPSATKSARSGLASVPIVLGAPAAASDQQAGRDALDAVLDAVLNEVFA